MITKNNLKLLMLVMPLLLAGCSNTNKTSCNLASPPQDMMQPPLVTEFIEPLLSLTSAEKPKKTPQN